jgi:hypothetical protein
METVIILIGLALFTFLVNLPLGMWRESVKKFSVAWFIAVHASVPVVIALRIWLDVTYWAIPILIGIAVLGQFFGARMYKNRVALQNVKKVGEK